MTHVAQKTINGYYDFMTFANNREVDWLLKTNNNNNYKMQMQKPTKKTRAKNNASSTSLKEKKIAFSSKENFVVVERFLPLSWVGHVVRYRRNVLSLKCHEWFLFKR